MKRILLVLLLLFFSFVIKAQAQKFGILKGNAEQILATYLDRDSAMLFSYDRAGNMVVWDVNNMLPIRTFNPIPSNIWSPESNFEQKHIAIGANKNFVWINSQTPGYYTTKRTEYAVYNRLTGKTVSLSDNSHVTNYIHLNKDNEAVIVGSTETPTYTDGKINHGHLTLKNNKGELIKTISLPGLATAFKVSDDEKFIAVGYMNANIDVFNLTTLEKVLSSKADGIATEVREIGFTKDNSSIFYTYRYVGTEVYFHKIGDTKCTSITMDKNETDLRTQISKSGNFLGLYNQFKLAIYDIQNKQFVKKNVLDSVRIRLHALSFLTDDILILGGSTMSEYAGEVYGVGTFDKANLTKFNTKTGKSSANGSFDDLNRNFLNKKLELVNDSTFKITGGYNHIIGANRLTNDFAPSVNTLGNFNNDAPSSVMWYLDSYGANDYRLYKSGENNPTDTTFVANIKKIKDFGPAKVHADAGLVIWGDANNTTIKKAFVSDFNGKIIYEYNVHMLYEESAKFSRDGKWFLYHPNASEAVVVNMGNPTNVKTYKTGLLENAYLSDWAFFDEQSTQIAFRNVNTTNLSLFTLLSAELKTGKTDTLMKLNGSPYGYGLSGDFQKIALSFAFNIADTVLAKNQAKLKEATSYGFRNVYKPVIILIDLKKDSILNTFTAKNSLRSQKMLVTSNSVIALQEDGLIYHYNRADTTNVITQWLLGTEQALIGKNYYYASAGVANRITIKNGETYYPVGEQDRFYNKPHLIMQNLGSKKLDLVKMYTQAYDKRLKQYSITEPAKTFDNLASLAVEQNVQQEFYTTDSILKFNIKISKGTPVKKLYIKVNDFSVYGKNGMELKPNQLTAQVQIPLEINRNNILIQGVDEKGRYLKPVRLDYLAKYNVPKQERKLFIISAGVSKYQDESYNLKYAAKDAADFAKAFTFKDNFDTIIVKTLTNNNATSKNIIDEITAIKAIHRNDIVMVFLAGHGVLDDKANFYFATHDMDFNNPTKAGLAYEKILNAMEDLPTKYKVLLLDACHSGLLDRSSVTVKPTPHQTNNNKIVLQDQRGTVVTNKAQVGHKEVDVFLFMQRVFSNFSYDNNINILSASLGNSYALENDSLQNGLFTYSLIRGVGLAMAAKTDYAKRKYGEASLVELTSLINFLSSEVKKLSNGRQTPTFSMSKSADWVLFTEPSIAIYTYDLDYKPLDPKDYKPSKETQYRTFLDRYRNK